MRKFSILIAALSATGFASAAMADDLSGSIMRPSVVDPATASVGGALPGGAGPRSYFVAMDGAPGDLVAQLIVSGRNNGERRLTFQLLDGASAVAASAFVRAGFGARDETTRNFPIDAAGRRVARLIVEGEETGRFCVMMGGSALPNAKNQHCPGEPAQEAVAAPPPPPPPPPLEQKPVVVTAPPQQKPVEVIVAKCEERLRVGSDFLFDFDHADLRAEAAPALAELMARIEAAHKPAVVEGHTDGIGTESYNQRLSERRASVVRNALVGRGLDPTLMRVRGYGKSRPVAPNQNADGSDNPDGREKNRRVEVVIDTCG
jgi:photosystem I P700 chlorophyll a apoprotein A2